MNEYIATFFAGVLVGLVALTILASNVMVKQHYVKKGVVFKVDEATYQCKQINKLEYVK